MENEIILTDKNGQRIDDLQKYYDDNPEILKRHIEKLNKNKKWEPSESLFNPENVKLLIEVHEVGVFRKTFKSFYLNWLNEIQTHSKNKNFLLEQKEKAQRFIDDSNNEIAYRPDNLMIKKNGKYVISTMKSLQNEIDTFLSRLEREKAQSNTNVVNGGKSAKKRILAFNNGGNDEENVNDAMDNIKIILDKINELLFVDSTPKQWEQLLKGDVLEMPIVIKDTILMEDFKHFIDKAKKEPAKIFGSGVYTAFEDNKAFFWNGNLLTRHKISNCYKRNEEQREDAGTFTNINEIFLTLI